MNLVAACGGRSLLDAQDALHGARKEAWHIERLPATKLCRFSTYPISPPHSNGIPGKSRVYIRCAVTQLAQPGSGTLPNIDKEPHKYFDQVILTVRSGDGGHGAILSLPRTSAKVQSKKNKDDQMKKGKLKKEVDGTVILPMGGHGGDVVIYACESQDNLLEYHKKKRYYAKRGGNVDAMGYLTPLIDDGVLAPSLRIPVPVGTVVKRKRGAKLLADLVCPGDEVLVARGGQGGISMMEIPKSNKGHLRPALNAPTMKDPDEKALVLGAPGEEVTLELTLRVVADVGLVGLPNAGKSSLLAAVTRAKPDIAEYPFTTLMPNLGHLSGDPEMDGGYAKGPKMADLPGLIKGAHLGKGLGKMFLRHLRRTRVVVHVVDTSAEDPFQDYKILREELLMYNPDYLNRPHIVVLNKLDIPVANERFEMIKEKILEVGCDPGGHVSPSDNDENGDNQTQESPRNVREFLLENERNLNKFPRAAAIAGISALQGTGIDAMLMMIRSTLQATEKKLKKSQERNTLTKRRQLYNPPQWEM